MFDDDAGGAVVSVGTTRVSISPSLPLLVLVVVLLVLLVLVCCCCCCGCCGCMMLPLLLRWYLVRVLVLLCLLVLRPSSLWWYSYKHHAVRHYSPLFCQSRRACTLSCSICFISASTADVFCYHFSAAVGGAAAVTLLTAAGSLSMLLPPPSSLLLQLL